MTVFDAGKKGDMWGSNVIKWGVKIIAMPAKQFGHNVAKHLNIVMLIQ